MAGCACTSCGLFLQVVELPARFDCREKPQLARVLVVELQQRHESVDHLRRHWALVVEPAVRAVRVHVPHVTQVDDSLALFPQVSTHDVARRLRVLLDRDLTAGGWTETHNPISLASSRSTRRSIRFAKSSSVPVQ
ncbi:hypothetical protein [Clavibacter phage 33]|nr:hypothetical protein [Clavibacter phage 33]